MPRTKKFDQEEVLRKAMHLFWKEGYYNTSVQDLVDVLGINRASLYDTFGGKKKLFDKAFDAYRSNMSQGLDNFLQRQDDVKSGLRILFEKMIRDDHADPDCKGCFIVNTTTELIPADPLLQPIINEHKLKIETLFLAFLKKGQDSGQISTEKNLNMIANLLYILMTGLRVVNKTKPELSESIASVDAVLSLLD